MKFYFLSNIFFKWKSTVFVNINVFQQKNSHFCKILQFPSITLQKNLKLPPSSLACKIPKGEKFSRGKKLQFLQFFT